MNIKESGEMYLETIYLLSKKKNCVRSLDIAKEMNFSKPSVSRAVHLLEKEGLIIIDENSHISLSKKGLSQAKGIYDRHTTLEIFLESLGIDAKTAEEDACRMEHVISDITLKAIKDFINK